MKARLNQTGALASFVVIGVVLVLVAGGLLYWVNHRDAASPETPPPVATQPDTDEQEPAKDNQPEAIPGDTPSQTAPTPPESTPAPVVEQLSQTGPVDTAMQVVVVGLIVAALAGFINSRKLRSSL